jgi:hypothetical protein
MPPRELSELKLSSFIADWELIPPPKPVTYEREIQTDPVSFKNDSHADFDRDEDEHSIQHIDNLGLSKKPA